MLSISFVVIYFVSTHRKKYLTQQNKLLRIESEKEQELLKAVIKSQEDEKNRIARNLHDSVGAELSMLKLNLSKHLYFMKDSPDEKEIFEKNISNLDRTIETMSGVCRDLYPLTLSNYGLIRTLVQLTERLNEIKLMHCVFNSEVKEEELNLNDDQRLNYYRVFQEVLNNLIKYSQCKELSITLKFVETTFTITFVHDGIVFTNEDMQKLIDQNKGLGLSSINNRVNIVKGKINYFREASNSYIKIEFPKQYGRKN